MSAQDRRKGQRRNGPRREEDATGASPRPSRPLGGLPGVGDLLTAIIDSSDDAILSKTLEGQITSWNPAAERLYGYSAEEAVGQNITMLAPDDRLNEMAEIIRRVKRGERLAHYITQRKRKDGRIVDVTVSISPIFDADGNIVGASSLAHELTDNERRIASIDVLGKRIQSLGNHVSTLAASVGEFMSREQVTEEILDQQKTFAHRLRVRTAVGILLALLSGVSAGVGSAWLVHNEAHRTAVRACRERANANQAIRDIVDRSQTPQLDASKLSPTAREILAEFARAQERGDQQTFRDFVYSKTRIPNCSKV